MALDLSACESRLMLPRGLKWVDIFETERDARSRLMLPRGLKSQDDMLSFVQMLSRLMLPRGLKYRACR